jgi:hypothetical protein
VSDPQPVGAMLPQVLELLRALDDRARLLDIPRNMLEADDFHDAERRVAEAASDLRATVGGVA